MAADGGRAGGARPLAPRLLLLAAMAAAGPAQGAPGDPAGEPPRPSAPAAKTAKGSSAAPPEATLGPFAAALEGTWEFRSMSIPRGPTLTPPAASGVIVIDRGIVLAASYVQASADRKVGNLWEGRMIVTADGYDIVPEKGIRYDSGAKQVVTAAMPPASKGTIETSPEGIAFRRADGSSVTFEAGGRRVQRDADGTVIVHERTSIVPRIPADLPGRAP